MILHLPLSSCFRLRKSADLQVPRWIDPCKARPFTSIRDFAGVPMTDDQEQEVFDAVIAATRMANTHAERIKFKFVSPALCSSNCALPASHCITLIKLMTACGGDTRSQMTIEISLLPSQEQKRISFLNLFSFLRSPHHTHTHTR